MSGVIMYEYSVGNHIFIRVQCGYVFAGASAGTWLRVRIIICRYSAGVGGAGT